ncbi:hypothetical protein OIU80_19560 [Flavobacterium sp. LS1R47]|uniref:Uncharacterized protein n=1 Tax=Flavobacterium frigoritolerans TaxID=2987686 RepID=A0A9X3CAA7_9FLAO|nr:hypothetical protein [Flavobacterium frigoritolerans]MCV9934483.1 hypothetical protein [Flavobacterium frigoritolerans]
MSRITFEEYKSGVKTKYQSFKLVEPTGILLNPSPAQLRNLCLILFDKSLSINDENAFRVFLNAKEGEDLRRVIERFEISRFRPVISFLTGETESDNPARIELAAVLVDFEKRPYSRFLKEELVINTPNSGLTEISIPIEVEKELLSEDVEVHAQPFVGELNNSTLKTKKNSKNPYLVILAGLLVLAGLFAIWSFNDEENCMVWNKDHYEEVPCEKVSNTMTLFNPIVTKKDESLISNFKKIKACDTTSFFKMGKPCIWYGKSFDGSYEYFTAPGLHPETGKTLKSITPYIIDRHILKNK